MSFKVGDGTNAIILDGAQGQIVDAGDGLCVGGNLRIDDGGGDPGAGRVWTTQKVYNVQDYGAQPGIIADGSSDSISSSTNVLTLNTGTLPSDVTDGDILWVHSNSGNYGAYEIQSHTTNTVTVTSFSTNESNAVTWRIYRNNQAAFQDALDAPRESRKGGVVYVPEGVYFIYSQSCNSTERSSTNTGLVLQENISLMGCNQHLKNLMEIRWDSVDWPPKGTVLVRVYEADNESDSDSNAQTYIPFVELKGRNIAVKGMKIFYPKQRYLKNDGSVINPSGASYSSNIIQFTSNSHGLSAGDVIEVTNSDPSGYDGSYPIQAVDTNTFDVYSASDPGAFVSCDVQKKVAYKYPYTIKSTYADGHTNWNDHAILDMLLLFSYYGIDFSSTHSRHFISGLYGAMLKEGITIDNCSDTGRVSDIHFNPQPLFGTDKKLYNCWTMTNSTGLHYIRADGEFVYNIQIGISKYGMYFEKNSSNGYKTWGTFNNVLLDNCDTAIYADCVADAGILFTNLMVMTGGHFYLGLQESDGHMVAIHTTDNSDNNNGMISLCNATLYGTYRKTIELNRGKFVGTNISFLQGPELISGSNQTAIDVVRDDANIKANFSNIKFSGFGNEVVSVAGSNPTVSIIGASFESGDSVSSNVSLLSNDANNNIGIGTTDPGSSLDVNGEIRSSLAGSGFTAFGSDSNHYSRIWMHGESNYLGLRTYSNDGTFSPILIQQQDSTGFYTRVAVTSDGNLGVGTDGPSSKLEVDGGDIEVDDSSKGLILRSPDGHRWRLTIGNGGDMTTSDLGT